MKFDITTVADKIRSDQVDLFSRFDVNDVTALMDSIEEHQPYHFIPLSVTEVWDAVEKKFGRDGIEAFHRLTLLTLIAQFDERSKSKGYSPSILSRFVHSFQRIFDAIQDPSFEHYKIVGDIFLKDLALCRQRMFPAGAQIVVPQSSFHRALFYRGGIGQMSKFAALMLKTGGNKNWFQIHTHLLELEDFNPNGWDECYLRIADMLAIYPSVRGMWGGSWFYDPALEEVSPRLSYLRKVPAENGAYVFYSNIDIDSGALATSESRKKAYENGNYLPKSYSLMWPRRAMLD
jgi:hypothetical protein